MFAWPTLTLTASWRSVRLQPCVVWVAVVFQPMGQEQNQQS